jgi:circadian clock protein KaiB
VTLPHDSIVDRFEDEIAANAEAFYELTLFISGATDLSARAIANARQICDIHLSGRYHLSVVDVNENPAALLSSRVLAAPTLVKNRPLPERLLVGDLSHTVKVLLALGLPAANDASETVG